MISVESYGNVYYLLVKEVKPGGELLGIFLRVICCLNHEPPCAVYCGYGYMSKIGCGVAPGTQFPFGEAPLEKDVVCTSAAANCEWHKAEVCESSLVCVGSSLFCALTCESARWKVVLRPCASWTNLPLAFRCRAFLHGSVATF